MGRGRGGDADFIYSRLCSISPALEKNREVFYVCVFRARESGVSPDIIQHLSLLTRVFGFLNVVAEMMLATNDHVSTTAY